MNCKVCGSSEFAFHGGIEYCTECNTQIEEARKEESQEGSFSKKSLIHTRSSGRRKLKDKRKVYSSWISMDAYNIILYKQVSSLISLGASVELKNAVLYIWSQYLKKCEIAFREDYNAYEEVPRLGPFPRKRDVKVLYGDKIASFKKSSKGKKVKNNPDQTIVEETNSKVCEYAYTFENEDISNPSATASSSDDTLLEKSKKLKYSVHARKLQKKVGLRNLKKCSHQSMTCVYEMSLSKTLCFCYLGLIYMQDQLLLLDIIRLANEKRIPYINAIEYLPSSMKLQHGDALYLTKFQVPSIHKISITCAKLIDFLKLPLFKHRQLMPIISRFVKDLNLPDDLIPVVKILVDGFMEQESEWYKRTGKQWASVPLYEIQSMAFIIVALKMLFVLDGTFEKEHSDAMRKINTLIEDKCFVWQEWKVHISLVEYLFLNECPDYSNLCCVDELSADKIINKYPFIRFDSNPAVDCAYIRKVLIAKDEMKSMLSNLVTINDDDLSIQPTSFPLKTQVRHFITQWKTFPMFNDMRVIDFSILNKDFSSHSFSFSPHGKIAELNALIELLLASLYESVESRSIGYFASYSEKMLRTSSKYWFLKCSSKNTNYLENLPRDFKWLLNFLSKYLLTDSATLYTEIMKIEKRLFFHRKCSSV